MYTVISDEDNNENSEKIGEMINVDHSGKLR